jgi:hypothetical protein
VIRLIGLGCSGAALEREDEEKGKSEGEAVKRKIFERQG